MTAQIPFAVKMLYNYHVAKMGKKAEEFESRTTTELLPE